MGEPGQGSSSIQHWIGLTLIYRPIQAPRAQGDRIYMSSGKMLHVFHSVFSFLPGPLKEEKIQRTAKAEMLQIEWMCSGHLQRAEDKDQWVEVRDDEITDQQRKGLYTRGSCEVGEALNSPISGHGQAETKRC